MEESDTGSKKRKINLDSIFPGVLGLLAVVALAAAGFFYFKYQKANTMLTNPEKVSAQEAKAITDKISKFYTLPSDETPNVATVLDIEKLKDQPFFANAQNGDKVLIYQKAALAILYRPDTNKIITISPVSNTATPTPAAEMPVELTPTPKATATPISTPEASPEANP